MTERLSFPEASQAPLLPYLPPSSSSFSLSPSFQSPDALNFFTTLTFATSLDSSLSLAPGIRTRLSGLESKAMTHFLRSHHDAILIGVNTAIADDPGLNCRIAGSTHQPRPIIVDPKGRWQFTRGNKIFECCRQGMGLGPLVLVVEGTEIGGEREKVLREVGGRHVVVKTNGCRFAWKDVFNVLKEEGLKSVMVEGGANIINDLLRGENKGLVDSVIVTIAPTWLGQGGVVVSPPRVTENGYPVVAVRLKDARWTPFGEDVVLCGRIE